jgi:hypothetical protein
MSILTKSEKEKLVLELHSMGKTYPEIAKEARISVRDIKPVLVRAESGQSLSVSSQAYKLFSERKTETQVAIELDIRQPQAHEFFTEYWKLQQLDQLYQIFQEIRNNIYFFLQLYRQAIAAGMSVQDVIRALGIAKNDLRSIEYRYQELKRQSDSLVASNLSAANTFQDFSNQISDTRKTLDQYELLCKEKRLELAELNKQKDRLHAYMTYFKDNSEEYSKIKDTIKREVESVMTDPKQILLLALRSVVESARKESSKFTALVYNFPSPNALGQSPAAFADNQYGYAPYMDEQYLSSEYSNHNEETYERILLNEAEQIYDKMVIDLADKAISNTASKNEPSLN